jgi:hypothetical protein
MSAQPFSDPSVLQIPLKSPTKEPHGTNRSRAAQRSAKKVLNLYSFAFFDDLPTIFARSIIQSYNLSTRQGLSQLKP